VSEVETRLAEIRERAKLGWVGTVEAANDVRWLLDQLARVRTDTIASEQQRILDGLAAEANDIGQVWLTMKTVEEIFPESAAVREVSHEH
jgi:uncharacterized protein (DUF2252 family)